MDNSALDSLRLLPEQVRQTLKDIRELKMKKATDIRSVAIAGMGGSIYNYHVIRSLFKNDLHVPLISVNEYGVPNLVNQNTLFIASSYSGSTEEVVFNLKQAHKKGAQCIAISAGGDVAHYCKENDLMLYQFDPVANPSKQPRMGQGYMIFGTIGILIHAGLLKNVDMLQALQEVESMTQQLSQNAKSMAGELLNAITIFVAAEHLLGNAHIVRNQVNETAKAYADYHCIPELNHHLMEGLKNPTNRRLAFVFFESSLYFSRIQKRFELTRDVVGKNKAGIIRYTCQGSTKLSQVVEILILGGYLTYYLSELYGENPNAIPWVDYFKEKLGKLQ